MILSRQPALAPVVEPNSSLDVPMETHPPLQGEMSNNEWQTTMVGQAILRSIENLDEYIEGFEETFTPEKQQVYK